jgi:hypothetical protein
MNKRMNLNGSHERPTQIFYQWLGDNLLKFLGPKWYYRLLFFLGLIIVLGGALYGGYKLKNIIFSSKDETIDIKLQIQTDFNNILFTKFDFIEIYDSKSIGWTQKFADLGKSRYFGIHPHLCVRLFNGSRNPISISSMVGQLEYAGYIGDPIHWQEFNLNGFKGKELFPLYLNSQQEAIIILPFNWPISEELRERLPKLKADSLYPSMFLVQTYLQTKSIGMFGSPGGYGIEMHDILCKDLAEQMHVSDKATGKFTLIAVLSNNKQLSTSINLP